jgi:tRNA A-37 threonylcarbamoyl transferase component Bud32/TolB-like protein
MFVAHPPRDARPHVSHELREQLERSLGGSYRIERELGDAGMSRVFVAEELRLRRRVAIKVLAPELAAELSLERFEREVLVAARLQDPHIVPVLAAGEIDGTPYYTMPYLEGPSLRARLRDGSAGGRFALADGVAILRDVARALAYAHAHGVVHRDIKPENVLLAGDTALVTDFGIAKALAASTTRVPAYPGPHDPEANTLTRVGLALGTPAYMAPEQVTGEPVDARTDLYAWGVVAYELLSRRHPFAGHTTAQRLVAAQLGEMPPPLAAVAPDVPPALSRLVMRCLAKSPADRPSSADELVVALREWVAGTGDGSPTRPGRSRRGRYLALGGLVLAVAAGSGWLAMPVELRAALRTWVTRPPATLRVNRVVVAPFSDETRDASLAPLGALTADYLTEGLARLSSVEVVDRGTAAQTGELLRHIPRLLRAADDRALGEETGAKVVVAGSYYRFGDSLVFRARILDASTGAVRTAFEPVTSPVGEPTRGLSALRATVVAALRAASDPDAEDLGGLSPPPTLEAYAAFRDGYQAYLHGQPDSAIFGPLRRAMSLDSSYAAPVVAYAFFAPDRLGPRASDSALARALLFRDRLTTQEQALVDLVQARAEGDAEAMLDAASRTGIQQLVAMHALMARRPRTALAVLRSTDPDRGINIPAAMSYWTHLANAYAQLGEFQRALDAAHEGERRAPILRELGFATGIAAARGDVAAVSADLEARWRGGERPLVPAINSMAMFRLHARRDRDGARLAGQWADRFVQSTSRDWPPSGAELAMVDLLGSVDRWREAARYVDLAERRLDAEPTAGEQRPELTRARQHVRLRRAVCLIHLGRRAEALAIDSAFALASDARWQSGASLMARAVIATHLGERERALDLLRRGIAQGGLGFIVGGASPLMTVDDLVLFLPLRDDPRFRALAGPDPRDDAPLAGRR